MKYIYLHIHVATFMSEVVRLVGENLPNIQFIQCLILCVFMRHWKISKRVDQNISQKFNFKIYIT